MVTKEEIKMEVILNWKFFLFLSYLSLIPAQFIETSDGLPDNALKYKGYKVFRALPSTVDQLNAVLKLGKLVDNLDFWTEPRVIGETVDVMVPPASFTSVIDYLQKIHVHFDVMIEDLHSLIYGQMLEDLAQRRARPTMSPRDGVLSWSRYYRLNDIHAYMNALASRYPSFVTVFSIGSSTEGRELKVIKIGFPSVFRTKKPSIWIDAGIHAREWVAPATATYFIDQLVNGVVKNNSQITKYARELDWYILPVANPDGYEFTHTGARMWRKTRARHGLLCRGVDPNRNFGFHWNEEGASSDPCSEIYAGPKPFSEPESHAMAQFILNNNDTIKMYLTMHSYGQYWLTPWGYTRQLANDYRQLYNLAAKAADALKSVSGTDYTIGSSTNVLYAASGGSDDWAKGFANIKYAYTLELRDRGRYGFLLPPRLIEPTAKETWAAIKILAEAVSQGRL